MRLLFDLNHPVDINFFKNAIRILAGEHGGEIDITLQPRGKLVPILQKELPQFHFTPMGMYRKTLPGKIYGAGYRFLRLAAYLRRGHFDAAVSFGGISIAHATWLLGKPSICFDDDVEYKLGFYPYKPFATRIVMPAQIPATGRNIFRYRGFKELAYLHPRYFHPDGAALAEYGLKPEEYVFVREVSKISQNYAHLETGQLAGVCGQLKDRGLRVVLSLEDKSLRDRFTPHCTILEEPVKDIYSLMSYARLAISSGDTMAREACLAGTPVIYTGGRFMTVNTELVRKGIFFEPDGSHSVMDLAGMLAAGDAKEKTKATVDRALQGEWDDTTQVIVSNVLEALRRHA